MKTKLLLTTALLALSMNSSANFIQNKVNPHNVQDQILSTPYYSTLANLKKDYQDIKREQRRFSDAKEHSIMDIRKAKLAFFSNLNWTPPKIATYSHQNFGLWDAAFLWYALDNYENDEYALFFHHHKDDPGIELFKKEVRRFSNIEPKYRNFLYRIEQKNFLEDSDSDYLPNNITPLISFSEQALHYDVDSEDNTLRIVIERYKHSQAETCEQWKNSNYLSLYIECDDQTSNNKKIEKFLTGQKDAMIIQSDVFSSVIKENPVVQGFQGIALEKEYLFMMVPKGSNIFSLNDLKNKTYPITVFSDGIKTTLETIGEKVPELKDSFSDINTSSGSDAYVQKQFNYADDILFISCNLNDCPTLDLVNEKYHENYEMIPVNFWQLLKERDPMGNLVYTQGVIPYKYPNIQNPDIYQKHDIKHIGFYNYLIISDYWFEHHKQYIRDLEEFLKKQ